MKGWIGVDLDGTLARYDHWRGEDHIGEPIPAMVGRVQGWIAEGEEVRIFTARASLHGRSVEQRQANVARIKAWCVKHIGRELDVTSDKDWGMKELWDDRAVQVAVNTGRSISEMRDARIRDSQTAALNAINPDAIRAEKDTEIAKLRAKQEDLRAVLTYARAVLPAEKWTEDTKRMIDAALADESPQDDRAIAVVPNKGITRFDRERTLADALETVMIQMGQLEKMFDGDEEFMLALEIGRKAMAT